MFKGRIRNLSLTIRALARILRHGALRNAKITPKKILVVQLAKLGDMVCTTPLFRAYKKHVPDGDLWVLGDRINRELLEGNDDVGGYIVYEKNPAAMAAAIRQEHFDAAIMTGPSPEVLATLILAGVPAVVAPHVAGGFSPQETRSYRMLQRFVLDAEHTIGQYAPREYLKLLQPFGIVENDSTKHLTFSQTSKEKAENFFRENNLQQGFVVGVFPSTGYEIKRWPAERFAAVADYLIEKYQAKIVVPGADSDRRECEEMIAKIKHKESVVSALGKFSVEELKALIAKLKLFISVDTGPIYIAEAFGVPTIDIVGPMDDREQPPVSAKHKIVKVERKAPQLHVMNTSVFDYPEAVRQRDGITVEMVEKVVDDLMLVMRDISAF